MVKNPPAVQETWIRSLGWEDPLEEGMATHSSILAWRIPKDRGVLWATVYRVAESDMTEQLMLWASQVVLAVKNLPAMRDTLDQSLSQEDPLEEGMATHSNILAWRIPMDRGGWRTIVIGLQRVRHD